IQRAGIGEDFAKLLVRILKFWKSIAESNKGFGEFSLFSTHQIILDIGFNLRALVLLEDRLNRGGFSEWPIPLPQL
ncbi:MAG TPA: hypothetical protein DEG64_09655, partial [Marinobacter adhaerens]|nr:hypothetical protein [Marinobacter adhaerens]